MPPNAGGHETLHLGHASHPAPETRWSPARRIIRCAEHSAFRRRWRQTSQDLRIRRVMVPRQERPLSPSPNLHLRQLFAQKHVQHLVFAGSLWALGASKIWPGRANSICGPPPRERLWLDEGFQLMFQNWSSRPRRCWYIPEPLGERQ